MNVIIHIRGDFKQTDVNMLDQYIQALVREQTKQPIGRVVYHGVVKQSVDELREQLTGRQ